MRVTFHGRGCFPTGQHYPGIAHLIRVVTEGLAEEFDGQTAVRDLPIVAIDTETTGTDSANDRVIEVGAVVFRDGQVTSRRSWLINPSIPIPEESRAVHGISDDDVSDKPLYAGLIDEMVAELSGAVPLAYNARFDMQFIHAENGRAGRVTNASSDLVPAHRSDVTWLDPFLWVWKVLLKETSKRGEGTLGAVCERLGVELGKAHRASDDAEAAGHVMSKLFERPEVPGTYAAFVREQHRLQRRFDEGAFWKRG